MPELPEVEAYRALAQRAGLGRRIATVEIADPAYLKRGVTPAALATLGGHCFSQARRKGKLLLLDTDDGPTLGVRFGMTGRLVVDGIPGVDSLLYTTAVARGSYERFAVDFADGGRLVVIDPRRLGGVELDPDEARLGPDALTVKTTQLRRALEGSSTPLKARLLDQSRISGVGNLIADEALWRAGLDPGRPAGGLAPNELVTLGRTLRRTIRQLVSRGGSHTGDLLGSRVAGGRCPVDGTPLVRRTIGGRTTWSCPSHQVGEVGH